MARLIDASALETKLVTALNKSGKYTPYECGLDDAVFYLNEQPTIDAVEVVRCKDCARRKKGYCSIRKDGWGAALLVGDTDFCSDGERRADNGN